MMKNPENTKFEITQKTSKRFIQSFYAKLGENNCFGMSNNWNKMHHLPMNRKIRSK